MFPAVRETLRANPRSDLRPTQGRSVQPPSADQGSLNTRRVTRPELTDATVMPPPHRSTTLPAASSAPKRTYALASPPPLPGASRPDESLCLQQFHLTRDDAILLAIFQGKVRITEENLPSVFFLISQYFQKHFPTVSVKVSFFNENNAFHKYGDDADDVRLADISTLQASSGPGTNKEVHLMFNGKRFGVATSELAAAASSSCGESLKVKYFEGKGKNPTRDSLYKSIEAATSTLASPLDATRAKLGLAAFLRSNATELNADLRELYKGINRRSASMRPVACVGGKWYADEARSKEIPFNEVCDYFDYVLTKMFYGEDPSGRIGAIPENIDGIKDTNIKADFQLLERATNIKYADLVKRINTTIECWKRDLGSDLNWAGLKAYAASFWIAAALQGLVGIAAGFTIATPIPGTPFSVQGLAVPILNGALQLLGGVFHRAASDAATAQRGFAVSLDPDLTAEERTNALDRPFRSFIPRMTAAGAVQGAVSSITRAINNPRLAPIAPAVGIGARLLAGWSSGRATLSGVLDEQLALGGTIARRTPASNQSGVSGWLRAYGNSLIAVGNRTDIAARTVSLTLGSALSVGTGILTSYALSSLATAIHSAFSGNSANSTNNTNNETEAGLEMATQLLAPTILAAAISFAGISAIIHGFSYRNELRDRFDGAPPLPSESSRVTRNSPEAVIEEAAAFECVKGMIETLQKTEADRRKDLLVVTDYGNVQSNNHGFSAKMYGAIIQAIKDGKQIAFVGNAEMQRRMNDMICKHLSVGSDELLTEAVSGAKITWFNNTRDLFENLASENGKSVKNLTVCGGNPLTAELQELNKRRASEDKLAVSWNPNYVPVESHDGIRSAVGEHFQLIDDRPHESVVEIDMEAGEWFDAVEEQPDAETGRSGYSNAAYEAALETLGVAPVLQRTLKCIDDTRVTYHMMRAAFQHSRRMVPNILNLLEAKTGTAILARNSASLTNDMHDAVGELDIELARTKVLQNKLSEINARCLGNAQSLTADDHRTLIKILNIAQVDPASFAKESDPLVLEGQFARELQSSNLTQQLLDYHSTRAAAAAQEISKIIQPGGRLLTGWNSMPTPERLRIVSQIYGRLVDIYGIKRHVSVLELKSPQDNEIARFDPSLNRRRDAIYVRTDMDLFKTIEALAHEVQHVVQHELVDRAQNGDTLTPLETKLAELFSEDIMREMIGDPLVDRSDEYMNAAIEQDARLGQDSVMAALRKLSIGAKGTIAPALGRGQ